MITSTQELDKLREEIQKREKNGKEIDTGLYRHRVRGKGFVQTVRAL